MKYGFEPNENGRQILNIGDMVLYFGEKCQVVYKHPEGLINIQDGVHFHLGVHPNQVKKIKNDPHEVSTVKCDLCGKVWIAVRPEGLVKLECPNCQNIVHYEYN